MEKAGEGGACSEMSASSSSPSLSAVSGGVGHQKVRLMAEKEDEAEGGRKQKEEVRAGR